MMTIAIKVQYDGSRYQGFQRQIKGATIQGELERAIFELTGVHSAVTGSGRTDAGVHAIGQVISFKSQSSIPADRWALAMNTKLPQDIKAISSCFVDDKFNARFDAISKTYRYLILPSSSSNPLMGNYAWVIEDNLDIDAMGEAAGEFTGKHDFSAFRSAGSADCDPVRTISRFSLEEGFIEHLGERTIIATVSADGFLYKMVRNMAGALMEVGLGRVPKQGYIDGLLKGKDRKLAPPPAPGSGLYLMKVEYARKLFER